MKLKIIKGLSVVEDVRKKVRSVVLRIQRARWDGRDLPGSLDS
jgi:hypothetical protein